MDEFIAGFYDAENARHAILTRDLPFFMKLLPRRRQSILELCAGTGRCAIPLAQAGHRVVGVDLIPEMVALARQKRDAVGLTDRDLELHVGDAATASFDRRFDWIALLFNSLLHFTTVDRIDAILRTVRRHLRPSGRFFFDIFHPDPTRLAIPHEQRVQPDAFFSPALGRGVYRETEIRTDLAKQLHKVTFHYRWFDDRGRERKKSATFEATWFFPREIELFLDRHGMKTESKWGDYDQSPLKSDSPRIIVVARRK